MLAHLMITGRSLSRKKKGSRLLIYSSSSAVTRVEWNVTGTVLSSAGNDGNIRLWKATFGGTWRSMGHIHTNHGDEEPPTDDMEEN